MRILVGRRQETMGQLAQELGVTDRTIRTDITILTADYPLDTVRGHGGCVKVEDWYHPHKNILSQEQQTTLIQLLDKADEPQRRTLREMLASFGSPAAREQFLKEAKRL
jgi:transcriptional antiterminator